MCGKRIAIERSFILTIPKQDKQWFLEEIFKLSGGEIDEEMEGSIEEGIAP